MRLGDGDGARVWGSAPVYLWGWIHGVVHHSELEFGDVVAHGEDAPMLVRAQPCARDRIVHWFPHWVVAGDGASRDRGCASRLFNGNEAVRESDRGTGGEDRAGSGVVRQHTVRRVDDGDGKSFVPGTSEGVCRGT